MYTVEITGRWDCPRKPFRIVAMSKSPKQAIVQAKREFSRQWTGKTLNDHYATITGPSCKETHIEIMPWRNPGGYVDVKTIREHRFYYRDTTQAVNLW